MVKLADIGTVHIEYRSSELYYTHQRKKNGVLALVTRVSVILACAISLH